MVCFSKLNYFISLDDIDIVEEVQQRLPAIMEDQEYSLAKGLKTRLMNFGGKLGVDRNKNRDANKQDGDISSPKQGGKVEFADAAGGSGQSPGSSGDGRDTSESQSQRSKGSNSSRNGGDRNSIHGADFHPKINNDEKHIKISSSTIVFSKKSGILRQVAHATSGIGAKISEASTKASYSFTISSPLSSSSLSTKASSFTHSKPMSGHSSSIMNNIVHSLSKTSSSEITYGNQTQPHSSRSESKSASCTSSSSSSALLLPSSQSVTNSCNNSTEPLLTQHFSANSQPQASAKSYSSFAETFLASRKRPSQKSINKTSFSTEL